MLTIQLGHPKINTAPVQEFKQVKDVFLKLFHKDEESIYVFWGGIPIQLRYQEDLYYNFDAILAMAWLLQKEQQGETKVRLTNPLFEITMALYWHDGDLTVKAHFGALEDLYQTYADELNNKGEYTLSKASFLREWNTLLKQIIMAFKAGNIQIADGTEQRKLELLEQVEGLINSYGELYVK
ncbi:hypothetical protein [uncultured Kriegella sp.]|uniref:hypothetical protein n=1 Tax=uncultured Kriegella sp. TaxID=1798910 RepID=UPI0030DC97D5|tara:strand:+ start:365159 stop:365704 length:546 start_codon:yes stop_codon:yes gene_type:complete